MGWMGFYAMVTCRGQGILRGMDLFFSPLAGLFAAHLACLEAGVPVTLQYVDSRAKRLADGTDYRTVAPQGIVPALRLDGGRVLTESVAVLLHVAEHATTGAPDARARLGLVEWLAFVATELHKKQLFFAFHEAAPAEAKRWLAGQAAPAFAHVARRLADRAFVMGDAFSVADAYTFWVLLVAPYGGLSLDAWPVLGAYVERLRERPTVKQALAFELPLFQQEKAARAAAAVAAP